MLADEQLLQSHVVRGVLERMGNGGLHKTAGAVALGVDEVTLENAVLAICTKIAGQVLKEQRIASGLASLEKTAGLSTRALVGANLAGGAMLGGLGASAGADAVDPGGSHAGPIAAGALGGLAAVPGGAVLGGALGYAGGSAAKLLGIPGAQAMPNTLASRHAAQRWIPPPCWPASALWCAICARPTTRRLSRSGNTSP